MLNSIKMTCQIAVEYKWSEFELSVGIRSRCRWGVPELQSSPYTNCEKSPRRREFEGGHTSLKGEVMNHNPAVEICQDCTAILVDGKQ